MSKTNALKFLILQKLNKNKSKIDSNIHKEIAYSLNVQIINENYKITWKTKENNYEINVKESEYSFYIKSEFEQNTDKNQIDKNELNANNLVLKIIEKSIN